MLPSNVSPVLVRLHNHLRLKYYAEFYSQMSPLPFVSFSSPSFIALTLSQYAAKLEALSFPDTPLIVKVAKRALYRTN